MKKVILAILLAPISMLAFSQDGVAINSDGSSPDANAILDVKSTDQGILVPRTTIGALSGNTTGLLIYETDSSAFFYYDGDSWEKVANQYQLGGSSNYSEFEADGTLIFNGDATTWEDVQIPGYSTRFFGGNAPTFAVWNGSTLYLPEFDDDAGDDQVYFTVQIPHAWKEGSTIYPHVHFVADNAPASGTTVEWGLEYTWTSVNGTFSTSSTIYGSTDGIGTDVHEVVGLGGIDGTGQKISSMLICRLFRNASGATDDFEGNIMLLQFDIHYEVNSAGSRLEFIK